MTDTVNPTPPVVPPPPPTGNPTPIQPGPVSPEPPIPIHDGSQAPAQPGTNETLGEAVVAVAGDLHALATEVKAEYDAASPQTKLAFEQLLRDATILRGEGFLALKKLLGK